MPLDGHVLITDRWADAPAAAALAAMTAWVRVTRGDGVQTSAAPASGSAPAPSGWSKSAPRSPAPATAPANGTSTSERTGERIVWEGPARVQAQASSALSVDVADQQVSTRLYLVQLPLSAGERGEHAWATPPPFRAAEDSGDRLDVLACPGDTQLLGRALRVVDVQHGSLRWTRDIVCSDSLSANNPPMKEA